MEESAEAEILNDLLNFSLECGTPNVTLRDYSLSPANSVNMSVQEDGGLDSVENTSTALMDMLQPEPVQNKSNVSIKKELNKHIKDKMKAEGKEYDVSSSFEASPKEEKLSPKEEQKRAEKRLRNKESAKRSRDKKKFEIGQERAREEILMKEKKSLTDDIRALKLRVKKLELVEVACQTHSQEAKDEGSVQVNPNSGQRQELGQSSDRTCEALGSMSIQDREEVLKKISNDQTPLTGDYDQEKISQISQDLEASYEIQENNPWVGYTQGTQEAIRDSESKFVPSGVRHLEEAKLIAQPEDSRFCGVQETNMSSSENRPEFQFNPEFQNSVLNVTHSFNNNYAPPEKKLKLN